MSRPVPTQSRQSLRLLYGIGLLVIIALVLAGVWALTRSSPSTTSAPAVPHFVPTPAATNPGTGALRTVLIARTDADLPRISAEKGPIMTTLVEGTLPATLGQATVQTDENCMPDQAGVSHCLNRLELGGQQIVVQHHHKMSTTPCLTPGEVVNLRRADA